VEHFSSQRRVQLLRDLLRQYIDTERKLLRSGWRKHGLTERKLLPHRRREHGTAERKLLQNDRRQRGIAEGKLWFLRQLQWLPPLKMQKVMVSAQNCSVQVLFLKRTGTGRGYGSYQKHLAPENGLEYSRGDF
jgi:hypothetical protein